MAKRKGIYKQPPVEEKLKQVKDNKAYLIEIGRCSAKDGLCDACKKSKLMWCWQYLRMKQEYDKEKAEELTEKTKPAETKKEENKPAEVKPEENKSAT